MTRIEEQEEPKGTAPDITIEPGCQADPETLDPAHSGQTICFKNSMRIQITINVQEGLFADTQIPIAGGGDACRDVLQQPNEVVPYWYWVKSAVCPDPPPVEARPRIIVRPPSQE